MVLIGGMVQDKLSHIQLDDTWDMTRLCMTNIFLVLLQLLLALKRNQVSHMLMFLLLAIPSPQLSLPTQIDSNILAKCGICSN